MTAPLVTIGVLSFNRLRYLRALLESGRECVDYPSVQWLVVDGGSVEPGLREYLDTHDLLDDVAYVESGRLADLMTTMVERTRGEYLLMLPDRVQFIVRGPWLADLVEVCHDHARVGHVCFDVQRSRTLRHHFGEAYLRVRGRRLGLPFVRRPCRRYRTSSGREFLGYGRTAPGVNTGGISFNRTDIWHRLGGWTTTMGDGGLTNDAGLGAETEMLDRYRRSGLRLERFLMRVPVVAALVTDPRGTAAKIRLGNRRYGRYLAPPNGRTYYRIYDEREALERFGKRYPAPSFEEMVEPLGFELPIDEHGNLRKVSVIDESEPYELVAS